MGIFGVETGVVVTSFGAKVGMTSSVGDADDGRSSEGGADTGYVGYSVGRLVGFLVLVDAVGLNVVFP